MNSDYSRHAVSVLFSGCGGIRLFLRVCAGLLIGMLISSDAVAQRELKNIPIPDPELERRTFRVPDGFEVSLFAADPMLAKPIQMNFDPDGRLWVVSSEVYPQIQPGQAATDRVIVLEDSDHDGVADRTHVFADGLLIPTGIAPGDGGAYVANSTELLHFADTDGDLKADSKRVVLSGFGTEDTHHILHTLRWGFDGCLYFNQSIYIHSHIETPWGIRRLNAGGIWQFRPETLELGVFMRGLVNSWGHHFDRFGQSFATDGAGGEGINYVIPGAYYFTAADAGRILSGLNPGSPKHCGLELVETPNLPADWQGSAITNDFRGHRVVRFSLAEEGSGYVSREQQEVIWSDHVAFRPIDVKLGPDGAIYVADWYNPIIQHGEVDFRDERRDRTHGRIWRVRWTGAPAAEWHPISRSSDAELFELLRSPDSFRRQAARQVLRERGTEIVDDLYHWLSTLQLSAEQMDAARLEALWCLQAVRHVDGELLKLLLNSQDGRIRAAAVRVLSHWKYQLPASYQLLSRLVQDSHPRVRLEAVRALSFSPLQDSERQQVVDGQGQLVVADSDLAESELMKIHQSPQTIETALLPLKQPMDRFLDYGLWLTTRELSASWLPAFEKGQISFGNDAQTIVFAFSAIGSGAPVDLLMSGLYGDTVSVDQRAELLRLISGSADTDQLGRLVGLAVEHQDSSTLATLVRTTAERKVIPTLRGDELSELTGTEDLLLRRAALTAAAQWRVDSVRETIRSIAADNTADEGDRRAVFRGVAAGTDPQMLNVLASVIADGNTSLSLRVAGLMELVSAEPQKAAKLVGAVLAEISSAEPVADLTRSFLRQKQGADLLNQAIRGLSLNADVAREILRTLRESGQVSAELEATVRAAGNISSRRLLTAAQRAELLKLAAGSASAAEGEQVFRNDQLGCLKCHAVGGAGGKVGPDMVSLGASAQPDYLLESLLDPNAKVKENYHTIVVATVDGKVLSGIQIQQSDDAITLRTADDSVISVARKEIEETVQGVSLMPEGLVDALTDRELASLVRFLSELGRTTDYSVSRRQLARSWQVLLPTQEAAYRLRRTSYAQAASDDAAFSWKAKYSTVAGRLPLTDIPAVVAAKSSAADSRGVGFARTTLTVTSPGSFTFGLNSSSGLDLRIDDQPVDLADQFTVSLPAGSHRLTFIIDLTARDTPVQLELLDNPGSGIATFVQ